MRAGFGATTRSGRVLLALIALAGFARMPLPQPDFHNIRHHDAPGEVCEHHDHLLRWHPGAGAASDVSVLHWHWFLLRGDGGDPSADAPGVALHAHTPDAPAVLDAGPVPILSDPTSRFEVRRGSEGDLPCDDFPVDPTGRLSPRVACLAERPDATPARGPGLIVLHQRWMC